MLKEGGSVTGKDCVDDAIASGVVLADLAVGEAGLLEHV